MDLQLLVLNKEEFNMLDEKRKSGRTTRLIDQYIQLLFEVEKGEVIKVRDHYPSNEAHRILLDKIINRLKNEHQGLEFEYDYRERTIKRL